MKRVVVALFVLANAFAAPHAAAEERAKTPLAEALTGEAKALYEIGKTAFDAGDVPGALTRFSRAHELSNDPRLLWNMAACEAGLKHYARAMTLVDRYLASSGALLSDKDRAQANRFRSAAKPLVASVALTIVPADALVSVDGEPLGAVGGSATVYLDPGKRRVTFTRPGYRGLVRVEDARAGAELTWRIELARLRVKVLGE